VIITSLHRLADGLTWDNAGGLGLHAAALLAVKRAESIYRVPDAIHDATQTPHPDWDVHDSTGTLHDVALLDDLVVPEDDDSNGVGLEIESHALEPRGKKLDHLTSLDLVKAVDPGDPVTDREDTADLVDVGLGVELLDPALEDLADLGGAQGASRGCEESESELSSKSVERELEQSPWMEGRRGRRRWTLPPCDGVPTH